MRGDLKPKNCPYGKRVLAYLTDFDEWEIVMRYRDEDKSKFKTDSDDAVKIKAWTLLPGKPKGFRQRHHFNNVIGIRIPKSKKDKEYQAEIQVPPWWTKEEVEEAKRRIKWALWHIASERAEK